MSIFIGGYRVVSVVKVEEIIIYLKMHTEKVLFYYLKMS